MNNSRFNKAIEELHALRMNPQEKSMLHERIMTAIKTGKADQAGGAAAEPGSVPSPWGVRSFWAWTGSHRFASIAVAAFAIIILGGGGAAFAAQGSLPGDRLYPLKIAVIEPIEGALFISADAKAGHEAALVATRLAEADRLQEEGRYDESKQNEIRAQVALHTRAFEAVASGTPESEGLVEAKSVIAEGTAFLSASGSGTVAGTALHTASVGVPAVAAKAAVMMSATATLPVQAAPSSSIKTAAPAASAGVQVPARIVPAVVPAAAPAGL